MQAPVSGFVDYPGVGFIVGCVCFGVLLGGVLCVKFLCLRVRMAKSSQVFLTGIDGAGDITRRSLPHSEALQQCIPPT